MERLQSGAIRLNVSRLRFLTGQKVSLSEFVGFDVGLRHNLIRLSKDFHLCETPLARG